MISTVFRAGMPRYANAAWGGAAAAATTSSVRGEVQDAYAELKTKGYRFYIGGTASNAKTADELFRAGAVEMSLPSSTFKWKMDGARLSECMLAETNKLDALPAPLKQQLDLCQQLKNEKVKFFSHAGNTQGIALTIGPVWLLQADSLFASVDGGKQFPVESLEDLRDRLIGSRPAKAPMIQPAIVAPENDGRTPVDKLIDKGHQNITALEERLQDHTEKLGKVDKTIDSLKQEINDVQQRMLKDVEVFEPLRKQIISSANHFNRAKSIATMGAIGSLISLWMPASPIQSGVLIGSAAALVGGGLASIHFKSKVESLVRKALPIRQRLEDKGSTLIEPALQLEALIGRRGGLAAEVANGEAAVKSEKSRVQVLEMSRVQAAKPNSNETVQVESDALTIGGVRIPRRETAAPEDTHPIS